MGADSPFLKYVFTRYIALPSNTQFVKSGVKDAKFCATTNRAETLTSYYTLIRSVTVSRAIQDAIEKQESSNRHLKGNRYMTGGAIGSRKRKSDGEDESSVKKRLEQILEQNQSQEKFATLVYSQTQQQ